MKPGVGRHWCPLSSNVYQQTVCLQEPRYQNRIPLPIFNSNLTDVCIRTQVYDIWFRYLYSTILWHWTIVNYKTYIWSTGNAEFLKMSYRPMRSYQSKVVPVPRLMLLLFACGLALSNGELLVVGGRCHRVVSCLRTPSDAAHVCRSAAGGWLLHRCVRPAPITFRLAVKCFPVAAVNSRRLPRRMARLSYRCGIVRRISRVPDILRRRE